MTNATSPSDHTNATRVPPGARASEAPAAANRPSCSATTPTSRSPVTSTNAGHTWPAAPQMPAIAGRYFRRRGRYAGTRAATCAAGARTARASRPVCRSRRSARRARSHRQTSRAGDARAEAVRLAATHPVRARSPAGTGASTCAGSRRHDERGRRPRAPSASRVIAHASSSVISSPRGCGTGVSTYCACPPERCSGINMRRETVAATSAPKSHVDDVQAEVDTGRGAGRGHDRVVDDVQHARVELDERIARTQLVGEHPVRRRAPAVEQPRGSEHECARADRDDPRAAAMRATERGDQLGSAARHRASSSPAR